MTADLFAVQVDWLGGAEAKVDVPPRDRSGLVECR